MDEENSDSGIKKLLKLFRLGQSKFEKKEDEKENIQISGYEILKHTEESVDSVMIPRNEMITIESDATLKEAVDLIISEGFSRIPVQENKKDNIVGILHSKDIFAYMKNLEKTEVKSIMRNCLFVSGEQKVANLLEFFKTNKTHMAIVMDEYGGVDGLITLEDIMEVLFGNIEDEFDAEEQPWLLRTDDGYLVEADCELDEFNEFFGTSFLNDQMETLGGYLSNRMNKIPETGEIFETGSSRFEVVESDSRRILKVKYCELTEEDKPFGINA